MVIQFSAMAIDAWVTSLLAAFSHAGTALTVGILVTAVVLATRCKGRCREDEIFRAHVI
jgi:hypothetical protein